MWGQDVNIVSCVCSGETVPTGVESAREKMVSFTLYLIHFPRLWEAVEKRCCDLVAALGVEEIIKGGL